MPAPPGVDTADKDTIPIVWSVAGLTRAAAPVVSSHRGTRGLRRHAVRPDRHRRHPGSQRARPRRHADAVHPHGHPRRQRAAQSLHRRHGRSPRIPGAAASPSIPRRASRAAPTRRLAPPRSSPPSSAPRCLRTSRSSAKRSSIPAPPNGRCAAWCCTTRISPLPLAASMRSSSAPSCAASPRSARTPPTYPFVAALAALAADVKAVLGPATQVTYAADWSEYFGHQPADGTGDVFFHLDPLWASPSIDAVAIDLYWPLSDWRDGREHADLVAGAALHLRSRLSQIQHRRRRRLRLVLRQRRRSRRAAAHAHHRRRRQALGVPLQGPEVLVDQRALQPSWRVPKSATPTAWVPQSKPVWFTEIGCPAVDKGANQPNVFIDPKSSESFLPHFSRGSRDDLMQRRYLQALHEGLRSAITPAT